MEDINKLSQEEIIEHLKSGGAEFRLIFLIHCEPIIMTTIAQYEQKKGIRFESINRMDLIDKIEKDLNKFFFEIGKYKIDNFFGYIKTLIYHTIAEQGKDAASRKVPVWDNPVYDKEKGTVFKDVAGDSRAIAPGSAKYYGNDRSGTIILRHKDIPAETLKGIERSLEYIERLYKTKEKLRINPTPKMINILSETKERLYYLLSRSLGDVDKKISRYNELLKIIGKRKLKKLGLPTLEEHKKSQIGVKLGSPEFPMLPKKDFEVVLKNSLHPDFDYSLASQKEIEEYKSLSKDRPYWRQVEQINEQINQLSKYLKILNIDASIELISPIEPKVKIMPHRHRAYVVKNILALRIKPPRLMFEVWSRDEGLKKGKNIDRKMTLRIFRDLKNKTRGTNKEFLFKSINENNFRNPKTAIIFFENVRKSQYKKARNQEFYEKLVESIYKVSFIEGIEPNNLDELSMYYTREAFPYHYSLCWGDKSIKEAGLIERFQRKRSD